MRLASRAGDWSGTDCQRPQTGLILQIIPVPSRARFVILYASRRAMNTDCKAASITAMTTRSV